VECQAVEIGLETAHEVAIGHFFEEFVAHAVCRLTSMAIFSKCMSTLPLLRSILRRGEDGRDVKNGMTSFTNFKSFWRGRGRGRRRSRGLSPLLVMFMNKVNISREQAERRVI
jgi:hypothetical protein